ncbi:biotin transporter BioY [Phenylobacterium sp.]|uniref:biotin transporter BioY n=1 Tax=Phenylobacterium sp. TaxID=1871053 RepID=UPI0025DDA8CB|nr:biotin transporter BioY [Phenylobacterium sp.]
MTAAPLLRAVEARPFAWRAAAIVGGAGLMAASSYAELPLPGGVPLTLQTLALFVLAGVAGGRLALLAVLLWLAVAAAGLPVLAGGAHGLSAVLGHTAGFLAGMTAAAWICGRGAERTHGALPLLALFLAGHLIVLAVGWAGLASFMDPGPAFEFGVQPFILGAAIKSVVAAVIVWAAAR